MSTWMKISAQCTAAMKKEKKKGLENNTINDIMPLYKSTVSPHMKYYVQHWSSYAGRKKAEIGVHRSVTKIIRGSERLSYGERLQTLGHFSLERRQITRGMIKVHNIMKSIEEVNQVLPFSAFPITQEQ